MEVLHFYEIGLLQPTCNVISNVEAQPAVFHRGMGWSNVNTLTVYFGSISLKKAANINIAIFISNDDPEAYR